MSAVTGFHRLPILAIAALLAAGCGATAPTAALSTSAGPELPSSAPLSPAATSGPTVIPPSATPENGCPALSEDTYEPNDDFEVATPLGGHNLEMDFTRVSSNANPEEFVEFEAGEPYLDDPGRLVGRWTILVYPGIDYEPVDVPITLGAADAVLRVAGRDPVQLNGNVSEDGNAFAFRLPDVDGSVVIDFTVEFSDACYAYRAVGAGAFEMVRAAHAASCPTGHKGFAAHWAEMGELQLGAVSVDITNHQITGLWTPYAVAAQGGSALTQWDPGAPAVSGQAGGIVAVVPTSPDLDVQELSATYYRRGDVLDYRPGDEPRRVFRATADPYPDGHLDLLLPSDPGRYVAALGVDWESPCAYGGGYAGISIDVE